MNREGVSFESLTAASEGRKEGKRTNLGRFGRFIWKQRP